MKNDAKKAGASPKGRRKLNFVEKKEKLPLMGKSIFVDVKEIAQSRLIKEDIKRLGARVDEFFHKDINYVITSNRLSKSDKNDRLLSPESPSTVSTPSPFNTGPSPSPAAGSKPPQESVIRGKAIAKRAVTKETNPVLTNAENWGIKVVSLDAAQKWIQREISKLPQSNSKPKSNVNNLQGSCKVKRLKPPYLKMESVTRQYKVVYHQVEVWPHANVETPRGTCPFDGTSVGGERSREERGDRIGLIPLEPRTPESKSGPTQSTKTLENSKSSNKKEPQKRQRTSIIGGVRIITAGDIRRRKEMKRLQEKRRGYCECCEAKYDDLNKHVREEQHKEFIRDKKHYQDLDSLINSGPSDATFLKRVLEQQCSKAGGTHSEGGKSFKEGATAVPVQKVMKNTSSKTTLKIVNSEVKRRRRQSPRKVWQNASEHEQTILLKDSIEQDIRQRKEVRRSAEIDLQLDKHYVPTRTRNFLFVQGTSSQHSDRTGIGKSDIRTDNQGEIGSNKVIDCSVVISRRNEQNHSAVMKDLITGNKNSPKTTTCSKALQEGSKIQTQEYKINNRRNKDKQLQSPCINEDIEDCEKTLKSPKKQPRQGRESREEVDSSNVVCEGNSNQAVTSEQSARKLTTETKHNVEECILKRRLRSPKMATLPNKETAESKKDTQAKGVESKKEREETMNPMKNDIKDSKSTKVDTQKAEAGNEKKRGRAEHLKTSQSAGSQEKCEEKQGLGDARARCKFKKCSGKSSSSKVTNVEFDEEDHEDVEIVSCDDSSGGDGVVNRPSDVNNKNASGVQYRIENVGEPDNCSCHSCNYGELETSVDILREVITSQMENTFVDFVSTVIKSPKTLRSSKTYDNTDYNESERFTKEKLSEILRLPRKSKRSHGSHDSELAQKESDLINLDSDKRMSGKESAKKLESHREINDIEEKVLNTASEEETGNYEPSISTVQNDKKSRTRNLDAAHKDISPQKQRSLRSRKYLMTEYPDDTSQYEVEKTEGSVKVHQQQTSDSPSVINKKIAIKNANLSAPLTSERLQSLNEKETTLTVKTFKTCYDFKPGKEGVVGQSENLQETFEEEKVFDAQVEKSLYYIDRVHRLRSTDQRQNSVDRELQDISVKVQERNSRPNSPVPGERIRDNCIAASPLFKSSPSLAGLQTPNKRIFSLSENVNQTTPVVSSPKSGLSNTPRSNKRKRWNKRRESKNNDTTSNACKVKRLEKLKYPTANGKSCEKVTNTDNAIKDIQLTSGAKNKLVDNTTSKKFLNFKKEQSDKLITVKETLKDNLKSPLKDNKFKSPLKQTSVEKKCVSPRRVSTPLVWRNAKGSTPKGRKKRIKLNKSWSVLSDRSVNKLLHESDSESNFEGFEEGDLTGHSSLCSDASFVEINEVEFDENSDREWDLEQEDVEGNREDDGVGMLPEILSSPGKRSDSSWDTGFVDFIDTQLSSRKKSPRKNITLLKAEAASLCSPRRRRRRLESIPEGYTENQLHRLRKRRKVEEEEEFQSFMINDVSAQVDEDIQFNFSSPNKRKSKVIKNKSIEHKSGKSLDYGLPVKEDRETGSLIQEKKKKVVKRKKLRSSERKESLTKSDSEIDSFPNRHFPSKFSNMSGRKSKRNSDRELCGDGSECIDDVDSMPYLSPQGSKRIIKSYGGRSSDIPNLSPQIQRYSSPDVNSSRSLRSRRT
ncbi:uncharacterized protein LOC133194157 [Saccostrea echinata]|uniref:uncharacterized protein LOC133194157 n=1 Tax=Saccostrea echinata TaxID=191078 RepID=UPI002A8064EA|nr:uncharacterized protein LOC133194157 [Saccostrea echinata]